MSKKIKLESPFPEFPGHLIVPERLDANQYNEWYTTAEEISESDDRRHGIFKIWQARFGFIQEAKMDLGKGYKFEPTGLMLPDPQVAYWFAQATAHLIDEAQDAKNWQGLSADISNTESD